MVFKSPFQPKRSYSVLIQYHQQNVPLAETRQSFTPSIRWSPRAAAPSSRQPCSQARPSGSAWAAAGPSQVPTTYMGEEPSSTGAPQSRQAAPPRSSSRKLGEEEEKETQSP